MRSSNAESGPPPAVRCQTRQMPVGSSYSGQIKRVTPPSKSVMRVTFARMTWQGIVVMGMVMCRLFGE